MTHPLTHCQVHRAQADDVDAVTEILADGFLHGDLGVWLVPDLDHRSRIYGAYFDIFAEYFLEHGTVDVDDDFLAVALWIRVAGRFEPDIADYQDRLARATRDAVGRFAALDRAMHAAHPAGPPHEYLAFLAVRREHQGRGLGTRLLRHHHTLLDAEGVPAYLEATGERNARLYARHDYLPGHQPYTAADSPALRPMWRPSKELGSPRGPAAGRAASGPHGNCSG
jgi:ribosomal protein S18 acetylase RimI-like enzyme